MLRRVERLVLAVVAVLVLLLAPGASTPALAAPAAQQQQQAQAQAQPERPSPERLAQKRRAFARLREILKSEPQVAQVQAATLKFYRLEPDRLEAMESAAKMKGLVPELEGGMDNTLGHNFSNTKDGLYPILADPLHDNPNFYKERVSGSTDQLVWRVRAVWNLDRIIFNPEALDVKSLTSIQENLIREVTTLFFSRRRMLTSLILSPPEDEEDRFYDLQRIEEMTATLDAFTGGMFAAKAWKGEVGP